MGPQSNSKYSMSQFITDFEKISNPTVQPNLLDIIECLNLLKNMFIKCPGEFEREKVMERELFKSENLAKGGIGEKKEGPPNKPTITFAKYLGMVPGLILKVKEIKSESSSELKPDTRDEISQLTPSTSSTPTTTPQNTKSNIPSPTLKLKLTALNLFLDLFDFLGTEKVFIEFFFFHSIDPLTVFMLSYHQEAPTFTNRTLSKLISLLKLMKTNQKYFNTNSINKLLHLNLLLTKPSYCSNEDNLILITQYLNTYLDIMVSISKGEFKRAKIKDTVFLINSIMIEFCQLGLINCISSKINSLCSNEVCINLLECMIMIISFRFIFLDKLIKIDQDVKELLFQLDPLQEDWFNLTLIKFITDLVIISNELGSNEIFFVVSRHKKKLLDRFFLLFKCTEVQLIKLNTCLMMLMFCLSSECWEIMLSKGYLVVLKRYLMNVIGGCFDLKNKNEGWDKGMSANSIHSSLNKTGKSNEAGNASNTVDVVEAICRKFAVFADEKILIQMAKSDFYVMFFDVVLMMFHGFHERYRLQILKVFNVFTMFEHCKEMLISNCFVDSGDGIVENSDHQSNQINKNNENINGKGNGITNVNINENPDKETNEFATDNQILYDPFDELIVKKKIAKDMNKQSAYVYISQSKQLTTDIPSKRFFSNILVLLKLRINQVFNHMVKLYKTHQKTLQIDQFNAMTMRRVLTASSKEADRHEEISGMINENNDNIKRLYFEYYEHLAYLLSCLTNLFLSENFDVITNYILEDGSFIEKIKQIVDFFNDTTTFHKETESKASHYYHLRDYINQAYLLLFMIFPDALYEFKGDKLNFFNREDHKKVSTLMRLHELLQSSISSTTINNDFIAKIVFCINRFVVSNYLYQCYQESIIKIINILLPYLKPGYGQPQGSRQGQQVQAQSVSETKKGYLRFIQREIFRLIYNIHRGSNNLILYIKADSYKLHSDLSAMSTIKVNYHNKDIKHYYFQREDKKTNFSLNLNSINFTYDKQKEKTLLDGILDSDVTGIEELNFLYNALITRSQLDKAKNNLSSDETTVNELSYNELIKYFTRNNPNQIFDPDNILFPPFKKITLYKESKGVIFHSKHNLILSKPLHLGSDFTVTVRIFLPLPATYGFHTLLQDKSGCGGLFVVDPSRKHIGCFSRDGLWVDSGIDLTQQSLQNRWHHVALTYCEFEGSSRIVYFFNGIATRKYHHEKYLLGDNISCIGNSEDFKEPFGIFCDLKVYRMVLTEEDVLEDSLDTYYDNCFTTELNNSIYSLIALPIKGIIMKDDDESDENRFYLLRVINIFLTNHKAFKYYSDFKSFSRFIPYIESMKSELKEEVTKYILNIS